ncbi:MAG TPA: hypothetical protein VMA36_16295 [Candidatus Limnocylindria bacterium]|nr:hypothetical protein [Candidatus Limnocylindria bacterium]
MRALSLAAAIVAVYAVELLALEVRIHTGHASALEPGLPLVTIGKPFFAIGAATNALVAMCALAQAALLYLLATVKTHDTRLLRFAIPLGVAAMLALSLRTTFTNSDVYYYVYYGKSATLADAYTPRAEIPPLPAGFTGLNHVLTAPVVASVYGPAWQQFDRALVGPTRSLPQAVATVRLASAAALALTLLLVAALRLPATLTAAVALNPALYYAYAVQSHNDVYAVLATVAGLALLRLRSPALAALCGALAGAAKLSVVLVALAALSVARTLRARLAIAAAILAGCLALSWFAGGSGYFHAMQSVGTTMAGKQTSALQHEMRLTVQLCAITLALAAVVLALVARRRYAAASLIFPGVSGIVQPWYFPWGLAYALGSERGTVAFCTALPVLAFATDAGFTDTFGVHATSLIVGVLVLALARELGGPALRRLPRLGLVS